MRYGARQEGALMVRWEYHTHVLAECTEPSQLEDDLNELGEEGWELVCPTASDWVLILKRPKQAEVEVVDMEGERPPMTQFPNV
jgi:hypothetical protein